MGRPKTTIDAPEDEQELAAAIRALETTGRNSTPEERKADAYYVLDRCLKISRMKAASGTLGGICASLDSAAKAIAVVRSLIEIERETGTGINTNDESKFRRITHVVSVGGNTADFEPVPN